MATKPTKSKKKSFDPKTVSKKRWDLSGLFKGLTDPKIKTVMTSTQKKAKAFEKEHRGKVRGYSAARLEKAIREKEALITPFYKLSQYVHLEYAVDIKSEETKTLVMQVEELSAGLSNRLLFFELELGQIPDAKFKKLVDAKVLTPFSYKLSQIKEKAKHKLSEKEEQLINIKDLTGMQASQKLYSEISSSFQFDFVLDGKKKVLNGSELRALRQDASATVRRSAMSLFFKEYEQNQILFSSLYNNIVKDYHLESQKRGYKNTIEVMNKSHNLPNKTVSILHEVTTGSYPLVHDYYKLKKKLLKLSKLSLADIYAPLPEADRVFEWAESVEMIQDSFQAFDPEFSEIAMRMINEKRVDVPVTKTKRGGAFCSSSSPDIEPYVMLNYLGRARDVSTLAHELGHAIHSVYAAKQPLWSYHAILPLCETASVFCEMILRDYLLEKETDKSVRISLLCDFLEDVFATSHRQNMFSSFEQVAHSEIAKGWVGAEGLSDLYEGELKKMFGNSVTYSPEYRWEWSSIPHIYEVPFYVYSYNFGNLLVLALYQQYLSEGPSFVPKLKTVLSMGSSASPEAITKAIGVNINSPEFWQQSLDYVAGKLKELKSLCR